MDTFTYVNIYTCIRDLLKTDLMPGGGGGGVNKSGPVISS